MNLVARLRQSVGHTTSDHIECRRCGTTLSEDAEECATCGADEIAHIQL